MPGAAYRNTLVAIAALAAQANAFWRLPCASPVVVQRADPIEDADTVSKHVQ